MFTKDELQSLCEREQYFSRIAAELYGVLADLCVALADERDASNPDAQFHANYHRQYVERIAKRLLDETERKIYPEMVG